MKDRIHSAPPEPGVVPSPPTSGMPPKRRVRRVGIVVLVMMVVFGAYEFFLTSGRWNADIALANLDCSHPATCRYRPHIDVTDRNPVGKPYRFATNASGFRGPDVPLRHTGASTLRVQVYGDSMIFGIGVDDGETLPEALQRALQQKLNGRKVEVMNFGMPANFLLSNLRAYEAFGRQYEPDIVIFAHPRVQTHDLNWRVRQIKESRLMTVLMQTQPGRRLVNLYQQQAPEFSSRGKTELRKAWEVVAADQRAHGMRVYFFEFYSEMAPWMKKWMGDAVTTMKKDVFPADLNFAEIKTGLMIEDYRNSAWMLPGDGHPNAAGHEYFAGVIAARVLADLTPGIPDDTTSR